MAEVLETLTERLALLQKYEARFGPLDGDTQTPATTVALSGPAAAAATSAQQQTLLNGLQVAIPHHISGSASASASASVDTGVNTPESSPF
jgi:adenylate cyclase